MLRPRGQNLDLHYELRGDGPPLLLLMGWRGNLDWWPAPLLRRLEQRHRLILVDNRGAGDTGDPGGRYTMAQMAGDAAALLDGLGVARADVLGVSMGGMIAQELALLRPARVDRLVLCCTHSGRRARVRPTPAMWRAWSRGLLTPWRVDENLMRLLFSGENGGLDPQLLAEFRKMASRARMGAWPSAKQYLAILSHDTYARLPNIQAPTHPGRAPRVLSPDRPRAPAHARRRARRAPR
jgi:3-oxoadipate enol-lactonase